MVDPDEVEYTNWHRTLFGPGDLGKPKTTRLLKILKAHATGRTKLVSIPVRFETFLERGGTFPGLGFFACCGDNDNLNIAASRYFRRLGVGGIFMNVSTDATNGYVFIQEASADAPCWGCAFPERAVKPAGAACGAASTNEILDLVVGYGLFAVTTLLMPQRKRSWNFISRSLPGFMPDTTIKMTRSGICPLCGKKDSTSG